ncbi:hypothetical protein [Pseudomonas sp. HS6]|uniref:hypothetical protein n=1 Tax=Pseudomonas sp. HS6 TaxID=2850559 RepID=UPI0020195698|nr:hypothetical protein [Pseudomonas sp. HS6]UQS15180.1 hypothetical protein JJN09_28935 [Pseudomonas sp. HS6]
MPLLHRYESLLLKKNVSLSQLYSHRMSQCLALRLHNGSILRRINKFSVLDEIALLEKTPTSRPTGTKAAEKFRGPILGRFWHKHYFDAYHLPQNIQNKWFSEYALKHRLLKEKLHEILLVEEDDSDMEKYRNVKANQISHALVYGGIEARRNRRALTGEWLIYYVYDGLNYYLDLANHEELDDQQGIYNRLRDNCAWEFPFAFD